MGVIFLKNHLFSFHYNFRGGQLTNTNEADLVNLYLFKKTSHQAEMVGFCITKFQNNVFNSFHVFLTFFKIRKRMVAAGVGATTQPASKPTQLTSHIAKFPYRVVASSLQLY